MSSTGPLPARARALREADHPCSAVLQIVKEQGTNRLPVYVEPESPICEQCQPCWHFDGQPEPESSPPSFEVNPFSRPFPLELMVAIVSFADTSAASRIARTSASCYELFMPVLLREVVLGDSWQVESLFTHRFRSVYARHVCMIDPSS